MFPGALPTVTGTGFTIGCMTIEVASRLAELKHKMETREARIGIVGMGYVGLPLALLFSGERFRVTGSTSPQTR